MEKSIGKRSAAEATWSASAFNSVISSVSEARGYSVARHRSKSDSHPKNVTQSSDNMKRRATDSSPPKNPVRLPHAGGRVEP